MTPAASATWSLATVSGVLLAFIALETWRPRLLPPAIAFTAAGLIVGGEGLGWLEISPDAGSLRTLAEATLALVLFSDASSIDARTLRHGYALPARLLGIGLPLAIGGGVSGAAADDRGPDGGGGRGAAGPVAGRGGGAGDRARRNRRRARAGGGD